MIDKRLTKQIFMRILRSGKTKTDIPWSDWSGVVQRWCQVFSTGVFLWREESWHMASVLSVNDNGSGVTYVCNILVFLVKFSEISLSISINSDVFWAWIRLLARLNRMFWLIYWSNMSTIRHIGRKPRLVVNSKWIFQFLLKL